jgi:hypothetical protein
MEKQIGEFIVKYDQPNGCFSQPEKENYGSQRKKLSH